MPFLDHIVGLINQGLQRGTLTDKRFASGEFNGIAMNVMRDKVTGGGKQSIPTVWISDGEAKYIGIDDTAPLIIYHKVQRSVTVPEPASKQFGDGQHRIKNSAILYMIVYADRSRIRLSADELEAVIISGFIDEIPKMEYPSEGFSSLIVSLSDTNFNSGAVFAQEYPGADNFLKPESILFQINYKVESSYRKDCLAICGC
ncbi:MAG TPA: hypothetical protein VFE32_17450 [Puia sp.]|jgi:hypothetical protein|nr:hypothetical protein [Puia sp.]